MTRTAQKEEWITINQAIERMAIPVAPSTMRRWIEEDKYGIVAKKLGNRYIIRADTLPQPRDIYDN